MRLLTLTTAGEILDLTGAYLRQHGWCRGPGLGPNGATCILIAVSRVRMALGMSKFDEAILVVHEALWDVCQRRYGHSVLIANDVCMNSVRDALAVIREARADVLAKADV